MKKKILAMLMIMIMCVPFVTPIQANAASQAYREWSQADPEWGGIHLGASQYTMKSSGCLVTAIAMLICHTGSADASSFTPKTLVNYLNNNGGFTSGGALYWAKVNGAADGFTLYESKVSMANMTKAQKISTMAKYIKDGYGVIISVRNGGHWVTLDRIEGDTVYMLDPGVSSTNLFDTYSESSIDRLAIYKGKKSGGTVSGNPSNGSSDNNSSEDSDKVIATGTVNCSSLYVRSGDGTGNSIITSISKGTKVDILGEAKDSKGTKWYKVKVSGKTGYACAEYITVSSSNGSDSGNDTTAASGTGKVNCSSLNVRSGAGTKYDVVTTVSRNQAVTITGTTKDSSGDKWYSVTFSKSGKSYKGYVYAEYITVTKNDSNSNNSNNNSNDNTNQDTMSIAAVVNCDALNMRSGAGTNYSVVTTLTKNTAVTITAEAKDSNGTLWYKITAGNKKGYVHSSYLTKKNAGNSGNNGSSSDTDSDVSGKTMKVAYDAVNVRSGASTSKGVVCVVYQNETVTVTGQTKDSSGSIWYKVKTSAGKTGYIRSDLLKDATTSGGNNSKKDDTTDTTSDMKGQKMQVVDDGVNMRSGAGLSKSVVEVIYMEDTLTVLGEAKDSNGTVWYKVKAQSGNSGYIRSDMLKKASTSSDGNKSDDGSESSQTSTGYVIDGSLNVRSGAGTSYKVLVVLDEGTKVNITGNVQDEDDDKWYHINVKYSGTNYDGYVYAQYIEIR